MIKFIAGLIVGLTISVVAAEDRVISHYADSTQTTISAPVIDCGPTNKAVFVIDQGIPNVVPFTEDLLQRR